MAHCLQSTAAKAEVFRESVWFWTLTIVIWGVWRTEFVLTALPVFTLVRTVSIIVESRCDCWFVCFRKPERLEHFIAFLLHKQHQVHFSLQTQNLSPTSSERTEGGFYALHCSPQIWTSWDLAQASAVASGSHWHVGQQRKLPWLSVGLNWF